MDRQRFHLIDALRGFSALGVAAFHTYLGLTEYLQEPWPLAADFSFRLLFYNIIVFFVISGFVIAHSLYQRRIDKSFVSSFILRRSLRLDPPYWAMLILMASLALVSPLLSAKSTASLPQGMEFFAQFFYLQNFLGYDNYLRVAWTLCYEIQFYLYFILCLWLAKNSSRLLYTLLLLPVGLTFVQRVNVLPIMPGLFNPLFYCFLAGVFIYWKWRKAIDNRLFYAYFVVLFVGYVLPYDPLGIACCSISFFLFACVQNQWLHLFQGKWIQFLGQISYSLYLVHMLVANKLLILCLKLKPSFTFAESLLIVALSLSLEIAFAYLFYRCIERPCLQLAQSFRLEARS